jgi:hypothetical protein
MWIFDLGNGKDNDAIFSLKGGEEVGHGEERGGEGFLDVSIPTHSRFSSLTSLC